MQRGQSLRIGPRGTHGNPLGEQATHDGGADIAACADDEDGGGWGSHGRYDIQV
ncbi:hypothetical protein Cde04nite_03980 [Cellulomonas denverensis]|nr:hypothetical protein Cde04nite_03980 [Cellulomonas denverensis]